MSETWQGGVRALAATGNRERESSVGTEPRGPPVLAPPSWKPDVGSVLVDTLGNGGRAQHWRPPKSSSGGGSRCEQSWGVG